MAGYCCDSADNIGASEHYTAEYALILVQNDMLITSVLHDRNIMLMVSMSRLGFVELQFAGISSVRERMYPWISAPI